MRGTILGFDVVAGMGALSGDDGRRYTFHGHEWCGGPLQPSAGLACDFDIGAGNNARQLYPVAVSGQTPYPTYHPAPMYAGPAYPKSRVTAGLFALLLGGLGVHKFYLGYTAQGVTLVIANIVSVVLWIVLIGLLGSFVISVVCLIEGIVYLTRSDDEFHQLYVAGRRPWL